jgi:hypothetical protein
MSVGLLVVRLLYRLYVCVHLSKWFTFSLFLVVCLLLSGRPLHLLPKSSFTQCERREHCRKNGFLRSAKCPFNLMGNVREQVPFVTHQVKLHNGHFQVWRAKISHNGSLSKN